LGKENKMAKLKEKIGLIGVGNMGGAILEGLLTKELAGANQIWVYDKLTDKAAEFKSRWKVHQAPSNAELVRESEILILAVKPQDLKTTLDEMKVQFKDYHVMISILAGTPVQKIQDAAGRKMDMVRAMPNLGAKVGASLTAITGTTPKALAAAEAIFSGCGKTMRLDEKYFDLITALSGSGPAYFFYLMELMAKEGREKGLSADESKLVAVQTALGAALLAASSNEDPAVLRERVTSKGGTTEAALKELVKTLPQTFGDAIEAAYNRGRELSKG
jgi:pyrroline-5-carboxylate reductase